MRQAAVVGCNLDEKHPKNEIATLRPKNKFEYFFTAIGEMLYLIIFVAAGIFIIGYVIYELFRGHFIWFKKNPAVVLFVILFFVIGIAVFTTYKKDKNDTPK